MALYIREVNRPISDEPTFVISVAARLVEMHPQTLRYYERAGLVKPKRSRGHIRLYSQSDIERLRKIARLVDDLGVNLAGVEVILNLTEKMQVMQQLLEQYQVELPEDLAEDQAVYSVTEPSSSVTVLTTEPDADTAEPVPTQTAQTRSARAARTTTKATTPKTKRSSRNG